MEPFSASVATIATIKAATITKKSIECLNDLDKEDGVGVVRSAASLAIVAAGAEVGQSDVTRITCINEHLAGMEHPETGIPYEMKTIELDGEMVQVTVPQFDSVVQVQMPADMYLESDHTHFKFANEQLKQQLEENPELKDQFTAEQLEDIEAGDTPEGYTWHHSENPGELQLVKTDIHQATRHTGGRALWGGGSENR